MFRLEHVDPVGSEDPEVWMASWPLCHILIINNYILHGIITLRYLSIDNIAIYFFTNTCHIFQTMNLNFMLYSMYSWSNSADLGDLILILGVTGAGRATYGPGGVRAAAGTSRAPAS